MTLSFQNKIKEVLEWRTSVLVLCAVYWVYTMCINFSSTQLIILVLSVLVMGLNITAFMHRAWTHRAWKPNKYLHICALLFYTLGCTGKSIGWCAVHRKHHRFSDQPEDPHSPYHKGKLKILFCPIRISQDDIFKYARDLINDPLHMWVDKYYWFINVGLWLILSIINIDLLVLWLGIVGFHIFKSKLFLVISHNSSETGPTDSMLYSLIYLHGEPWHVQHHLNPMDWKLGHKWYEIDLGAKLIQLCVFLGWGKIKK